MKTLRIKHNKPIPKKNGSIERYKYPFWKMKEGDAIAVPLSRGSNLRRAAYEYKKKHPDFEYTTRTLKEQLWLWKVKSE